MDENLHNIDDLFKKALNDHHELPSENVWEKIDKNLDKKTVVSISQKYNKLKWVAAALLIFSAGMAMYTLHTRLKNKELVKQTTLNSTKQVKKAEKLTKDNTISEAEIEVEKKELRKDTTAKNQLEPNFDSSGINVATVLQNEKKNEFEKAENEKSSKKDLPPALVKNSQKAEKPAVRYHTKFEEQTVRSERIKSEKVPDNKASFSSEKQQSSLKNYSETLIAKAPKEVSPEIEFTKPDFQLQPFNSSLQNTLDKLYNNKTIDEELTANALKTNRKGFKKILFSATIFYSPDFVSSRADNDRHNFREDDRNEIKNKEKIRNSYSTGVLINYNATKRFSLQSGLTFSSIATDIQPKTIYARPDDYGNINYRFNCTAGYSYIYLKSGFRPSASGDSISTLSSKNVLNYVAVPLGLKYNISKGKLTLSPGIEVAVNFLTKGKIETVVGNEKTSIDHIAGLNSTYLNSALSLGMNYNINRNIALSLTPAARMALTSINKNTPIKTYLNSYGLAAGITIKL